jgi:hypothetical protein
MACCAHDLCVSYNLLTALVVVCGTNIILLSSPNAFSTYPSTQVSTSTNRRTPRPSLSLSAVCLLDIDR